VIRTGVLVVLLLWTRAAQAETYPAPSGFDQELAGEVFGTALAFMEPRILEPVAVSQLALWGMRGVTALDPLLSVEVHDGKLVLVEGNRVLAAREPPVNDLPGPWAAIAAEFYAAAWNASSALRRAGAEALVQNFFDELFNHFDPYSRYVPPAEASEDRANRRGTAGAGLTLEASGGAAIIKEAIAGGPAAEAGLRPGDQILAVNGRSTVGQAIGTVVAWIVGPEGTRVTLTWRGREGWRRTASLTRAVVPPETVFPQRAGSILLVRISRFDQSTADHLAISLTEAITGPRKPEGIVLDLRGNSGGLLRQAVLASDTLLPAGVVAITAGRDPQASRVWESRPGELAGNVPVVVLVDGRTASAAEVLAAALSDRGRAVVVGSSTLGKGLVQTIAPLPDGGELFVTWSRILAPLGWPIQGLGVLPQVCTSLGEANLNAELEDLLGGVQPLAAALARHRHARAPMPLAEVLAIRSACPAAEGRDADITTARYLLAHTAAYRAALIEAPTNQSSAQ
jgi:carboxyl-terminal processing protease